MQETPDSINEDIYDDVDSLFIRKAPSLSNAAEESAFPMSKCASVPKDDNCTSLPSTSSVDRLKKEGLDLYLELVSTETKNKKDSLFQQPEFVELQQKVATLENLLAEKDTQICNLEKQNINLLKNISSLYKTAKLEVAQKDDLLMEANKKIDELYHQYQRRYPRNPNRMETTEKHYQHSDTIHSHYELSRSSRTIPSSSWNTPHNSRVNKNSEEMMNNNKYESQRSKYSSPSQDASHSKFYDGNIFKSENTQSAIQSSSCHPPKNCSSTNENFERYSDRKSKKQKLSDPPSENDINSSSVNAGDLSKRNKSSHT